MSCFVKSLAKLACGACALALAPASSLAANDAPVGFWRTTNQCFLVVFVLSENGHAQTAYDSGEQEVNAAWTWDGATLSITSPLFPEDKFTAHMADDHVQAEYVWHDLDKDQLNQQACVFERIMPKRL